MRQTTASFTLALVTLALIALASAGSIAAKGPSNTTIRFDSWYTQQPKPEGFCDFAIDYHVTGHIKDAKWYDDKGKLVQETLNYGGLKYDLMANGKQMTVQNSGRTVIDYISPNESLITLSGQEWVWKIPGQGPVSGEIGHQSWTEFYDDSGELVDVVVNKLVGNIMWTDVTPMLCEYLAP